MDLPITFLFITLLFATAERVGAHNNPSPCSASKPDTSSDLTVFHIYGKCSPFATQKPDPWADIVLNMAQKDSTRLTLLASLIKGPKPTSAPVASGQQVLNIGNYLVRVTVGTPPQLMFMVLDTSLDVAWVPCSGCLGCTSPTIFSPNSSTTFGPMDCSMAQCSMARGLICTSTTSLESCQFNQSYGGDSSLLATLSHDSISLDKDIIDNYAFGCINSISGNNIPPQGLLGLGRGPLSLIAQSELYQGIFSYCLPSYKSYYFSGSLKLGPIGQPKNIKTTPLLHNPHRPSLYYVNLTSISIGRVTLPIPQEYLNFDPNTGGGTIFDSGTVLTRFVQPVYNLIRDEYRNQTQGGPFSSLGAFDTCFSVTHEHLAPIITLHFQDLDLKLPMENTLIHSSSGNLACLAMASAPSNVNNVLNIIASLQQQNLRILFDIVNSRVGISSELCN